MQKIDISLMQENNNIYKKFITNLSYVTFTEKEFEVMVLNIILILIIIIIK